MREKFVETTKKSRVREQERRPCFICRIFFMGQDGRNGVSKVGWRLLPKDSVAP